MIQQQNFVQPEQLNFKDDGIFPNSPLPLLFDHQAIRTEAKDPASIFEKRFAENGWTNSWTNGVYSFPHYHSTSHEVLGVYSGTATLRLGGKRGKNVEVRGLIFAVPISPLETAFINFGRECPIRRSPGSLLAPKKA